MLTFFCLLVFADGELWGLGGGAWLALTLGWACLPALPTLPGWPVVLVAGVVVGLGTVFVIGCTS
ncbi:hypothetical protein ACKC4W_23425, partial [Aeromonas veronii]